MELAGTHALNNIALGSGTGRLIATSGTTTSTGTLAFSGTIGAAGGDFVFDGVATAAGFEQTGGTIDGAGSLTIGGASSWTNGTMSGAGSTMSNGALELAVQGARAYPGARC